MIQPQPIGLLNTALPLAVLVAGAALLPGWLAGKTLSRWRLAVAVMLAALVLLVAGAVIFALLHALDGARPGAAMAQAPVAVTLFFLRLSVKATLLWGPVLALAWLVLLQGLERRRGEEMVREKRQ